MTAGAVAALLPVRLETRFIPPGELPEQPGVTAPEQPDKWRLRLRIVPDTLSVDTHDPAVAPAEKQALDAFWRALVSAPDPGDPAASARAAARDPGYPDAVSRLAAQVGAGRAAWLVRAVPVTRPARGGPVQVGDVDPHAAPREGAGVVRGFPDVIDVWVLWHGQEEPELFPEVPVNSAVLEAAPTTAGPPAWLVDWDAGTKVGTAAEITLPRHPREIAVLGVSGVRANADDSLTELLASHAATGSLSIEGPGEATTVVDGAPVVPTGGHAQEWFAPPTELPGQARRTLRALLGDHTGLLGPVRSRGGDELDERLLRLTFPALWGYGLTEVLGLVDRLEMAALWRWATRWLRPQGSFGTLVVDGTAYGVLPVVNPRAVAERPGDSLSPVVPLLGPLAEAIPAWSDAAGGESGASGGRVADVVRVLRRGPVPGALGRMDGLRAELVDVLNGQGPDAARAGWDADHEPALRVLEGESSGGPPFAGVRYLARSSRIDRLSLPLVVPTAPTADIAAATLVEILERWRDEQLAQPVDFGTGAGQVRCVYAHPELWDSQGHIDRTHPESLLARLLVRSVALAGGGLDLWRQAFGRLPLANQPEPPRRLGEPLAQYGQSTMVRLHLNALLQTVRDHGGDWVREDTRAFALAEELTWLVGEGTDQVIQLVEEVVDDPARHDQVHRALRALLESTGGRWDPWWVGVGAAHLHDVQTAAPTAPAAGIYGWVDQPWRGRPGPGPGGLLMAPSLDQATTAAALRDRAVHDPEARWDLHVDSATVGPARALLADIADGWHPAEVIGRLIESTAAHHAAADGVTLGAADLTPLREQFPLRTNQGHYGCCHGLDVLGAGPGALPVLARSPSSLQDAVKQVSAIWDTASDLLLAESVHGVLAGRPERAAVPSEVLAGQAPPADLTVLDPVHVGRTVRTLVLAALPDATPPLGATGVLAAAAGFDAAVRATVPHASWAVPLPGTGQAIPLEALGLAPVHTVVLDDHALTRLALLHAGLAPDPAAVRSAAPVDGAAKARLLAATLQGAAPDPGDLVPPALRSGEMDAQVTITREAALGRWASRTDALLNAADHLAATVAKAAADAHQAWSYDVALDRAQDQQEEPPDPPDPAVALPSAAELAGHTLALAAWGFAPPAGSEDLHAADPERQHNALAVTLEHLATAAASLAARVAHARSALNVATPHGMTPTGPTSASGASVLAELAAGRQLPVGTSAPISLLAEPLDTAAGTDLLTDWLPAIATVRPRLARVARLLDPQGDDLVEVAGVEPDDPWRRSQLAALPPDAPLAERLAAEPRLTVVVGPGSLEDPAYELVVVDSFAEQVPDREQHLGLAFDAATPSAAPPAAVLLVPSADPAVAVTRADLPAAVLLARAMGHARMATTTRLAEDRLGPLAAACLLPQDGDTGCPLGDPYQLPPYDLPAALVALPDHRDTDDVVAAVTADPTWMLGVQWRLGEHAGEDAASPVRLVSEVAQEPIAEPLLAHRAGEAVVEDVGWRPDRLVHAHRWGTPGVGTVVERHDAGRLDWWALTREDPVAGQEADLLTHTGNPTSIEWPGRPRRRYWEVDDRATEAVGRGPDRAHPASLHRVDLISRFGDDWYLVPLPGAAGGFVRVVSATLTDAAGSRWTLRTDPAWSLFAVTGADPHPSTLAQGQVFHRALPVLLGAEAALEGDPTEDIAFAVDEDANVLWAAVRRGPGVRPESEPTAGAGLVPRPRALGSDPKELRWELGARPPLNRLAYLYGGSIQPGEYGAGHDLFVQARIRDVRTGELTEIPDVSMLQQGSAATVDGTQIKGAPHTLRPLALPASGVRLLRRPVLARDVNGAPVRWWRTERRPLDVAVDVDLPWDVLMR